MEQTGPRRRRILIGPSVLNSGIDRGESVASLKYLTNNGVSEQSEKRYKNGFFLQ